MTRCVYCDIDMIDGQCPECRSVLLAELWRRQDISERYRLTEARGDPLLPENRRVA